MAKEVSAGFIVYQRTREGIKYLLLYRGYWNFSKGKLEQDERNFRAALRELQEETGLKKSDLIFPHHFQTKDKFNFFNFREKKHVSKTITLYLAESKTDIIKLSPEQEGYGWFPYREATRLVKHQNIKNILRRVNILLTKRSRAKQPS